MHDEKSRLMTEIRKMKDELTEALANNTDLEEKLVMVKDAAKSIGNLKETIHARDQTI